jgi:hypothetical protein
LSREAAREAERSAARRHELRLREAAAPGWFLREMHAELDAKRIAAGQVCLSELADRGELLFEHEYDFSDGLGGGQAAKAPAGPFRRVHQGLFGGPETISCPSCHWIGGPNGAGAETDNAMLAGDGAHDRERRRAEPTALVGLGVVQALASEMTHELQAQRAELVRDAARAGAGREVRLTSKGRRLRRPARDAEGRDRRVRPPRRGSRPRREALRLEGYARDVRGLRRRCAADPHGYPERRAPRERIPRRARHGKRRRRSRRRRHA